MVAIRISAIVIVLILDLDSCSCENYSRKMLQKKYPGFGDDFVIFPGENNEKIYGYFTKTALPKMDFDFLNTIDHHDVSQDITFTFYSRNLPRGRPVTNFENLTKFFDNTKKTKFVTHGWLSSGLSDTCITIKDEFLNKSDVNVFVVDWSPIAGNIFYHVPMEATSEVGEVYSKFVNQLVDKSGLNPKDIHLIGHSLGAHVSGFAGRGIKGGVARITGLDPALPGFNIGLIKGGRLTYTDADFVDVIHTCAGFLGMGDPIGHADFYPNGGGPPQPGCGILMFAEACSHGRSWKLFANSITLKEPYLASKCQTINNANRQNCNGKYTMMGEPTPPHVRGVYYVETTDADPFIKPVNFVDKNDIEQ